jgi:hypothetical protein
VLLLDEIIYFLLSKDRTFIIWINIKENILSFILCITMSIFIFIGKDEILWGFTPKIGRFSLDVIDKYTTANDIGLPFLVSMTWLIYEFCGE